MATRIKNFVAHSFHNFGMMMSDTHWLIKFLTITFFGFVIFMMVWGVIWMLVNCHGYFRDLRLDWENIFNSWFTIEFDNCPTDASPFDIFF